MSGPVRTPDHHSRAPGPVAAGHRHLWMGFSVPWRAGDTTLPAMVGGTGTRVYDEHGREMLDALSSLYCVNVGHGRAEIAEAMAGQARTLEYFPAWGQATPVLLELAERVAALAPGDLNRVFFTSGGADSVDAAWKLVRQYHRLRGHPGKAGLVARTGAYHGTTLGALPVTGVASLREPFEPLAGGVLHAPRVEPYRSTLDPVRHSIERADAVAELVRTAGAEHLGAIVVEPVQNSGGCLTPEPIYYERLRRICDENDLLLVSDETICSWGRLGTWFGCDRLGYQPDIITTAKGLTSAYAPMGAVIVSDRIAEPFADSGVAFSHGLTFGGHPVAAAAALANIEIIEREGLCARAAATGDDLRQRLEGLRDIPLVGDVRGLGLFQAIELVADQRTRAPLTAEQTGSLTARLPVRLRDEGIICRAMHRGAPTLQFAPPLVTDAADLDWLCSSLRSVLVEAGDVLH